MDKMIVDQSYWDQSYLGFEFSPLEDDHVILNKIREIPALQAGGSSLEVYEIGCFPGSYLNFFGQLGYTINGSDLAPETQGSMLEWLKKRGAKIATIYQGHFQDFPEKKFDIVCSFGFIEHFENFYVVFEEHVNRTKPGGHIIISWPNFKGPVQRILHKYLDCDNLNNHVLASMSLENFEHHPEIETVKFAGYLGGFYFWVDDFQNRNGLFKKNTNKDH